MSYFSGKHGRRPRRGTVICSKLRRRVVTKGFEHMNVRPTVLVTDTVSIGDTAIATLMFCLVKSLIGPLERAFGGVTFSEFCYAT